MFGKQYKFSGKTYATPVHMENIARIARTVCPLFDFIINLDDCTINFTTNERLSEDKNIKFKELYDFYCILKALETSGDLFINLVDEDSNRSVEVVISQHGCQMPEYFRYQYDVITATYDCLCKLDLGDNEVSLRYFWERISAFELFSHLNKNYDPDFELSFESNDSGPII